MKSKERINMALNKGMTSHWMSERKTAIQKSFNSALGKQSAKAYIIQSIGRNNNLNYFIGLTEDQVIFQ